MSEELKACPFCGGKAKIVGPVPHEGFSMMAVECQSCLAVIYANEAKDAVEMWSTRKKSIPIKPWITPRWS